MIEIFCDGACSQGASTSKVDHIGAYAAIVKFESGQTQEIAFSELNTTNNRMELMAAIMPLRLVGVIHENQSCDITIISDSQYLVKGITQWVEGWQKRDWKTASKQPVKNQDLWQELVELTKKHKVEFKWVKGHASCPENNRCDELAVAAIEKRRKEINGEAKV